MTTLEDTADVHDGSMRAAMLAEREACIHVALDVGNSCLTAIGKHIAWLIAKRLGSDLDDQRF